MHSLKFQIFIPIFKNYSAVLLPCRLKCRHTRGNIANGSPIGDSMPALITLGTRLILRVGKQTREIALEDFYLDYQNSITTW